MQYGRVLYCLLKEVVLSDPALVPLYILLKKVSDVVYCIALRLEDDQKIGLLFSSKEDGESMVAIPINSMMGRKNSPPLFCTSIETIADLANESLRFHVPTRPHTYNDHVEAVDKSTPLPPWYTLTCNSQLGHRNALLVAYIDVFVDNFLGIAQGPVHQRHHMWRNFLYTLEKAFRPKY